jgi:hypothetical protein
VGVEQEDADKEPASDPGVSERTIAIAAGAAAIGSAAIAAALLFYNRVGGKAPKGATGGTSSKAGPSRRIEKSKARKAAGQ